MVLSLTGTGSGSTRFPPKLYRERISKHTGQYCTQCHRAGLLGSTDETHGICSQQTTRTWQVALLIRLDAVGMFNTGTTLWEQKCVSSKRCNRESISRVVAILNVHVWMHMNTVIVHETWLVDTKCAALISIKPTAPYTYLSNKKYHLFDQPLLWPNNILPQSNLF